MNKSKFDINGVSDICGVTMNPIHRAIFFEIKTPETINTNTKTIMQQKAFLNRVKKLGAIAAMVCSLEELQYEFEKQKTL